MKELLENIWIKLSSVTPPAILSVTQIFIFGAATIYLGNYQQFDINLPGILHYFLLPLILSFLLIIFIGIIIPRRYIHIYSSLIFGTGILLFIQGNFLVWDYGLLDGEAIEWNKYNWQGELDGAIWICILICCLVFYKKNYKISTFFSLSLVSLQSIVLIFTLSGKPETWRSESKKEDTAFPEQMARYSSSFNIIHVILDSLETNTALEVISENSLEHYFNGFVMFKENLTAATGTVLSIPSIFSEEVYDGSEELESYRRRALVDNAYYKYLKEAGFDINVISSLIPQEVATSSHIIRGSYATKSENDIYEVATLMDIILFRYLPHYIKKKIYNNQNWTVRRFNLTTDPSPRNKKNLLGHYPFKAFFKQYISLLRTGEAKPSFHIIHLLPPHPPFVTDENCECSDHVRTYNRANYKIEVRCVLELFTTFLEKLKNIGLYDSSLIILQGDHGNKKGMVPEMMKDNPQKHSVR
jgi:hypothetical protein